MKKIMKILTEYCDKDDQENDLNGNDNIDNVVKNHDEFELVN